MKKDYADYLLKYSQNTYNDIASNFSKTRRGFWGDLNFLIEEVKEGQRVLDLGCGNGRLFNVLKNKNIKYIGVDNSEGLLMEAHNQFPEDREKFVKADALNLPFRENEFDVILSIAVLQHIPSKQYRIKFLQECLRTLDKNGKLMLTVWLVKTGSNHYKKIHNIFDNIKSFFGLSKIDANDLLVPFKDGNQVNLGTRYIHAFSLRELKNLFRQVDFKIEDSGYTLDRNAKRRNIYIIASKKD